MMRARPIFGEVESGTSKGKFSIYISMLMYWIVFEDYPKLFNTPYPPYINISYSTLMYWKFSWTLHPPHRKSSCILYGGLRDASILHDSGVPPTTPKWKNPAKIGARNSSFASFDLRVGVRLRGPAPQPDAQARSRGRNTRITRADFRWVFFCSGWVSYT